MPRMPRDAKDWLPDLIKAMNVRYREAAATQKQKQFKYQRAEAMLRTVTSPVWVAASSGTVYNLPEITPASLLDEVRMIARQQKAVVPRGMEIYDPDNPGYVEPGERTMANHEYYATIKKRTGAYAILRALYERMRRPDQTFTLQQIEHMAAPYCDTEMGRNYFENRLYAGISSLKTLQKFKFVKRFAHRQRKHEILLTQEGYLFAKAVFDHKFADEHVVGGGAYDHLADGAGAAGAGRTAGRVAARRPSWGEQAAEMPWQDGHVLRTPVALKPPHSPGSVMPSTSSGTTPFTGHPRFIEAAKPEQLDQDLQTALEASKITAMQTPAPDRTRDAQQNDDDLNVAIALSLSANQPEKYQRHYDPGNDDEDEQMNLAVQLSLIEPGDHGSEQDCSWDASYDWPTDDDELYPPAPIDDVQTSSSSKRPAEPIVDQRVIEPEIAEVDPTDVLAASAAVEPLSSPMKRKRARLSMAAQPVDDGLIDLTAGPVTVSEAQWQPLDTQPAAVELDLEPQRQISSSSTTSTIAKPIAPLPVRRDNVDRWTLDLSVAVANTPARLLPRHAIQQPGFLELLVDTHERSRNDDYLRLYYTMCERMRQTKRMYERSTEPAAAILQQTSTSQKSLRLGDFAYTWVNSQGSDAQGEHELVLDTVVERKKISDLVQRSAGRMGDHAEQLCRMRCAAMRHQILLIEGNIASAGGFEALVRRGADLEGPDVIDDEDGVIALVCRQIASALPGYDVKVMYTPNATSTAVAMAQLGVCVADRLAIAIQSNTQPRFPNLKDFNRQMAKKSMAQQRTDMLCDLVASSVNKHLAEHISQRFCDWGMLHTLYALCESDANRAGMWDHYCQQLNLPLSCGEAVWQACCARLGEPRPALDADNQELLQAFRSNQRYVHANTGFGQSLDMLLTLADSVSSESLVPNNMIYLRVWQGEAMRGSASVRILRVEGHELIEALITAYQLQADLNPNPHSVALTAVQTLMSKLTSFDSMSLQHVETDSPKIDRRNQTVSVMLLEALTNSLGRGGAIDLLAREVNKIRSQPYQDVGQATIKLHRKPFPFRAAAFVSDIAQELLYLVTAILMVNWNWHVQLCANEKETAKFLGHMCAEMKRHSFLTA